MKQMCVCDHPTKRRRFGERNDAHKHIRAVKLSRARAHTREQKFIFRICRLGRLCICDDYTFLHKHINSLANESICTKERVKTNAINVSTNAVIIMANHSNWYRLRTLRFFQPYQCKLCCHLGNFKDTFVLKNFKFGEMMPNRIDGKWMAFFLVL